MSYLLFVREGEPLPPVFKVFSTKPLDEGDLSGLFQPLHSYQVKLVFSIIMEHFDRRLWTGWPTPSTPWRMTSPPLCLALDYTTQAGLVYIGRFEADGNIILHQRIGWLLVLFKGKADNKFLGLSGQLQPWRCRCFQPAMSPISSRSFCHFHLSLS